MPKPRSTKSQAIRDTIAQHPRAKSREIVQLLADQGIKVSGTLVYAIRAQSKAKKRKQKRERVMANSKRLGFVDPVDLIKDVRRLSDKAGGIKHLKELVDLLAE